MSVSVGRVVISLQRLTIVAGRRGSLAGDLFREREGVMERWKS